MLTRATDMMDRAVSVDQGVQEKKRKGVLVSFSQPYSWWCFFFQDTADAFDSSLEWRHELVHVLDKE